MSELGEETGSSIKPFPMIAEKKLVKITTQSLTQKDIVFSKPEGPGYYSNGEMKLSTGTGETLIEWVQKKTRKNPFGMLMMLSARLDDVSGAAWHASLESDELVLLNVEIGGQAYFEVGSGSSRTKARKNAGTKIMESARLYNWIESNHSGELI